MNRLDEIEARYSVPEQYREEADRREPILADLRYLLDVARAAEAETLLHGCRASEWADEDPPVWGRCLDPDYIESGPEDPRRCGPCSLHAALEGKQ